MKIKDLDTPALLIDQDVLMKNIRRMQDYVAEKHIDLRPHVKTHKMPYIASLQKQAGAVGIAVAKTEEAEIMAQNGMDRILIANEVVGEEKLKRIARLSNTCQILYGVDSVYQIRQSEKVFGEFGKTALVVVEIEVGEERSGVIEDELFVEIISEIQKSPHVIYKGVFGHDGNSYRAKNQEESRKISLEAQERLLHFANIAVLLNEKNEIISYGSTPAVLCGCEILDGITELRVGTYALMDASQANITDDFSVCAATVLATVISLPTKERVILDVGAKGLTMQERKIGICASGGKGHIWGEDSVVIDTVFDEHAIIHNIQFHDKVHIGDKVRIIPAHICPVVNLYDVAYFCSGDEVLHEVPILCRGKMR